MLPGWSEEDWQNFPPPGRLVDTPSGIFHVKRSGKGVPVILEAGIGGTHLSWAWVEPRLAAFCEVFAYDRAGYGWSAENRRPKVARDLVEQLRELLAEERVPSPRILVGHSFGGMMMRLYAGLYPHECAGLVMVDALAPEEWFPLDIRRTATLQHAVKMAKRAEWWAEKGLLRLLLKNSGRRTGRLADWLLGQRRGILDQIRKLPREAYGPVRAHWSRAGSYRTIAEYFVDLPASCAQAQIIQNLGDLPLVVLAAEAATRPGHQGRQAKMARLSSRGDYRQIPGSTHWLMLDSPDVVVEAVREISVSMCIEAGE
jgi:pimeloyl-ACP methyl ester carboxylesterase